MVDQTFPNSSLNHDRINVVILNWDSSSQVRRCLESLERSEACVSSNIIIVDNYSALEEREALKRHLENLSFSDQIHLITNQKNYGYAEGNNIAFRYCKENNLQGDFLILNPDVTLSSNTVVELRRSMSGDVGAVMCRTVDNSDIMQYDVIKMSGFRQSFIVKIEPGEYQTDYAAGSCMLLNRNILDKCDVFDSRFFMYWEEVDLSYRLKKQGYKIVSTTKTKIYREKNSSIRNINAVKLYTRNVFYLIKKHPEFFSSFDLIIFLIVTFLSQLRFAIVKGEPRRIYKYFEGLLEGLNIMMSSVEASSKDSGGRYPASS